MASQFREYSIFFHDELEILNKDGEPPIDPQTGLVSSTLFAYVGDPVKIRLLHGGVKETHVFHLHNHQWRLEADNPSSTILDSISISPQECYTLDILYGVGSLNHVIGDVIFHCHLYPHFMEGMWTLWRIYDPNFVKNAVPGALYMDTCPCHTDENVKVFEIAIVQAKITYNRYGWHDPQGRFFVLKEEIGASWRAGMLYP